MFFGLYRYLSYLFSPLVKLVVLYRVRKNLDDKKRYTERFGIPSVPKKTSEKVIWFHAASVGESLSLLPIIAIWRKNFPEKTILLTTITKSAAKILVERLPEGCIHQYLPFDVYSWVDRFVNYWKPEKLIMVESEIWPNVINVCTKKNIPIILLNAKLSESSWKKWKKVPFIARSIFKRFDAIYAQSKTTQECYNYLGCSNVYVMPHLKYMGEKLPYNEEQANILKQHLEGRKFWLSVSTHPKEEEILCRWHEKLKAEYPGLLSIIIPRHKERVEFLFNELSKKFPNLNIAKHSVLKYPQKQTDIYIVDTLGEVGLFLSQAQIVFLGGTLVPVGGHNILEPIMSDAAVICGPHTHGISTLVKDLEHFIFLSDAKNDGLVHLKNLLDNPEMGSELTKKAQAVVHVQKEKIQNLLLEEVVE